MKYFEKYPRAVPVVIGGIMVAEHLEKTVVPLPCIVCKDTTVFVDTEFEESICSEECLKAYTDKWARFFVQTEVGPIIIEVEPHGNRPDDPGPVPDSVRGYEAQQPVHDPYPAGDLPDDSKPNLG